MLYKGNNKTKNLEESNNKKEYVDMKSTTSTECCPESCSVLFSS